MSRGHEGRFDSWKEIANYLGRDLRTVRRWEKERFLPVHRVPGGKHHSVYAYRGEIDAWLLHKTQTPEETVDHPREIPQSATRPPASPVTNSQEQIQLGDGKRSPSDVEHFAIRASHKFRLHKSGIAALVGFTAILLSALFFVSTKGQRAAEPYFSGTPIVPSGIQRWVRISLVNGQPESVIGSFQQLLVVDSSRYSSFEAENLQNIEFFDERGKILHSWLESGNSNLSTRTVYWLQLPEGLPASGVVNVYMGFAATSQNLFNGQTTGEAPGLTPSYAQYDNGNLLFLRYANFAGPSLPPDWYSIVTPEGQGGVRINNGVYIWHKGRGGGSASLGSDWDVGRNIAEMDLQTAQAVRGQDMILVCSASPTSFRWTPASIGYQDMSGLEIEDNDGGTPSVLAMANPNPVQSSVIGFQDGTLIANHQSVASVHSRICGGNYLASSVNSGVSASFSFDWVRMRVPPPNGVMPTAIFGQLK